MAKIVVTEFMSIDGVVEDPGGAEDYKHSGWSFEISRGEEGDQSKLDETVETDALLLGRITWQGFADAWPQREGEFADKFNNMPKYVVSGTLTDATWRNSKIVGAYDPDAIRSLKEEVDGDLYTSGSATLVRAMLEDGLIDGLHLFVFPLTRGTGPRLFDEGASPKKLSLEASDRYDNGVVYLNYRPQA